AGVSDHVSSIEEIVALLRKEVRHQKIEKLACVRMCHNPRFFPLARHRRPSYFRGMRRIALSLLGVVCLGTVCLAQENAARAAAEREAAEERYKLLNSAVEALTTGQADLQRRLSALGDEVRTLRAQENKIDTSKFVTREEFNRLVKAIDEIEQKRESDKKLIRDEFEQLKKDIVKLLNAPAPAASQ